MIMKRSVFSCLSMLVLTLFFIAMMAPGNAAAQDPSMKNTWPELVGKTVDQAKALLAEEAPGYNVQVIPFGYFATEDYRTDRIRIWLGQDELVERPPRIG